MNAHQVCTDCPQTFGICRSPNLCARFERCFDLLTPHEELKLLECSDATYYARKKAREALA